MTAASSPSGGRSAEIVIMEKISFPSAGLLARNLGESGDGAHPVPCGNGLAGFSHPRPPKISKVVFGPDGSGERNFLPDISRISPPQAALGRSGKNRNIFSAVPPSEADTNRFLSASRSLPKLLQLPTKSCIWKDALLFSHPYATTVGRMSAEGGRFCGEEIFSAGGGRFCWKRKEI